MAETNKKTTASSKSSASSKSTSASKATSTSKSSAKETDKTEAKKTTSKKTTDFDTYKANKKNNKPKYEKEYKSVDDINADIDRENNIFYESAQTRKVKDEIIILFALLLSVLMVLSYFDICGVVGTVINCVLFGLMGIFAYVFPIVFFGFVLFILAYRGKSITRSQCTYCAIIIICFVSILHVFTVYDEVGFWESFKVGFQLKQGGGLLGELLAWPLCHLFHKVATVIIEVVIIVVCIMMLTGKALLSMLKDKSKEEYKHMSEVHKVHKEERVRKKYEANMQRAIYRREDFIKGDKPPYTINGVEPKSQGEYVPKKKKDGFLERLKETGGNMDRPVNNPVEEEVNNKQAANNQPKNVKVNADSGLDMVEITGEINDMPKKEEEVYLAELKRKFGNKVSVDSDIFKDPTYDVTQDFDKKDNQPEVIQSPLNNGIVTNVIEKPDTNRSNVSGNFGMSADSANKSASSDIFARGDYKKITDAKTPVEVVVNGNYNNQPVQSHSLNGQQQAVVASPVNQATGKSFAAEKVKKPRKPYQFPPLNKLNLKSGGSGVTSQAELRETAKKLQDTLASFGVKVTVTDISCGPSVTRYELAPEQGVKVSKITSLADDIKLNLAASDIRIEAPIPGKSAVGIEVPNKVNQVVTLGSLINSEEFKTSKKKTTFAVGKDIGGQVIVTDIAKMPHLLIAGATGSGKSVCINTLIVSILYKATPEEVKMILIDPKVVELSVYNGIPHLLIPVVTDPKKASGALYWAVTEMTDRFKKFAELGVRDLEGFNKRVANFTEPEKSSTGEVYEKMPQIVIIIDELADLMMVASNEVEDYICRIAQLARAAGIHLVIATQRPSVNVITGLIKANVPSRIAFSVASQIDSRTILDMQGAEKLLGKGDMLFAPSGIPKPLRVQGAYVSDDEVTNIVEYIKEHNDDDYDASVEEKMSQVPAETKGKQAMEAASASEPGSEYDEYLYPAGVLIISKQKASIGALQRQFKIGFNRAARIMDQLSEFNVVGPEEGTKPRQIIMDINSFEAFAVEKGIKQ